MWFGFGGGWRDLKNTLAKLKDDLVFGEEGGEGCGIGELEMEPERRARRSMEGDGCGAGENKKRLGDRLL